MSKPYRDASSGTGLDVVVSLPVPVVERIGVQAKVRGETVAGWRRDGLLGLVEGTPEVPPEDLAFDVRMALAKDPAARGMDELAMRMLADRAAEHLAQSRLRFLRMAPLSLHSAGYRPEPVGSELLRSRRAWPSVRSGARRAVPRAEGSGARPLPERRRSRRAAAQPWRSTPAVLRG